jgi:error-prone DNA polymerase
MGVTAAVRLRSVDDAQRVTVAGYAIVTQRPGTANGMLFQSLEDETGIANVAVMPHLCKRFGPLLSRSRFLLIEGKMQNMDGALTVRAEMIKPLNLTDVQMTGRSFR